MRNSESDGPRAGSCSVIVPLPREALRSAATEYRESEDPARISRAERAIEALSPAFHDWMRENVGALEEAAASLRDESVTIAHVDRLMLAASDLLGEASVLGYPLSGRVAGSLCELIEYSPDKTRIPLDLVDRHVDAVIAELRRTEGPPREQAATQLAEELHAATRAYLQSEARLD